jgi:hypothetical protein|nr:MAG TPA: hypothetical protein [Caudoviricetes sp.]
MAQHPFAAQARAVMEENGIVFNTDGSTSVKQVFVSPEQTQAEPANNTPPENTKTAQSAQDERDRLIEMQRAEIERLKSLQNQYNTQAQPQRSEREEELERELTELRGKLHQQTEQEQADEFRAILERQGFDSENFDDDVLIELRDTFIKPVANKLAALEERLGKTESKFREPTPEEKVAQTKQQVTAEIYKQIPDFGTIFNSPSFQERLGKKDSRFPFKQSYGHALQEAYENGNTEFIVSEVKAFMNGTTPDLSAIADVGATNGVGTGQVATNDEPGYSYSQEEAEQMLRKRQRGDVSRQEYSEYRAKLDAHNRSRS